MRGSKKIHLRKQAHNHCSSNLLRSRGKFADG